MKQNIPIFQRNKIHDKQRNLSLFIVITMLFVYLFLIVGYEFIISKGVNEISLRIILFVFGVTTLGSVFIVVESFYSTKS